MVFRRTKVLIAATVVVAVGFWLYAVGQSLGQFGSLIGRPGVSGTSRSLETEAFRVRPPVIDPDSSERTAEYLQESAFSDPEIPDSPDRAYRADAQYPDDEPEPFETYPASGFSRDDDVVLSPSEIGSIFDVTDEDFPYQRSFDPLDYERAVNEHRESLRPVRLPPGVESMGALVRGARTQD